MHHKEYYVSPAIEVIGVNLETIVCVSGQEVEVQADTDHEFSNGNW